MKKPSGYVYLFGGAIGDTLLGVHIARTLNDARPGSVTTLLSTRENPFVRDLVAPLSFVRLVEIPKGRPSSWLWLRYFLLHRSAVAFCKPLLGETPFWWRLILRAAALREGNVVVQCVAKGSGEVPLKLHTVVYDIDKDNMFDLVPKIVSAWGLSVSALRPQLDASLYREAAVPAIGQPYIVFHFFGGLQRRTVSVTQARRLLEELSEKYKDYMFVLTCAKEDRQKAQQIAEGFEAQVLSDLPAADLVRLLVRASAYVGVDTGITHIACHLGVPAVVLGHIANKAWMPSYAATAHVLLDGAMPEDPYAAVREVPVGVVSSTLQAILQYPHA